MTIINILFGSWAEQRGIWLSLIFCALVAIIHTALNHRCSECLKVFWKWNLIKNTTHQYPCSFVDYICVSCADKVALGMERREGERRRKV